MNYSRFKRRYILLENPAPEFSTKQALKGHARLETGNNRGNLRIGIQNLIEEQENEYEILLAGGKDHDFFTACMGKLLTDSNTYGSYACSFNPNDVDGKGHPLHDFHTLIITAQKKQQTPLYVIRANLTKIAYPITNDMLQDQEQKGKLRDFCLSIEECLPSCQMVYPFREEMDHNFWWKIENISKYPCPLEEKVRKNLSHYQHYLFGLRPQLRSERKIFFLAIPSMASELSLPMEQYFWRPLKDAPDLPDCYGYYISCFDASTGDHLAPDQR